MVGSPGVVKGREEDGRGDGFLQFPSLVGYSLWEEMSQKPMGAGVEGLMLLQDLVANRI